MEFTERIDRLAESINLLEFNDAKAELYITAKANFQQECIRDNYNQFSRDEVENFKEYCDVGLQLLRDLKKFGIRNTGTPELSSQKPVVNYYKGYDPNIDARTAEEMKIDYDAEMQMIEDRENKPYLMAEKFKADTKNEWLRDRVLMFHCLFKNTGIYSTEAVKTDLAKFICLVYEAPIKEIKNHNSYKFLREVSNPLGTKEQSESLQRIRAKFESVELTRLVSDIDTELAKFMQGRINIDK